MIKIFTVDEAKRTILKRNSFNLIEYSPATIERTVHYFGKDVSPPQAVEKIILSVYKDGDAAVKKWSLVLDQFAGESFVLEKSDLFEAWSSVSPRSQQILQTTTDRIRSFHEKQPIQSWITNALGGKLGQRFSPISKVGVYVPGGTAPLPSSLLMSVIPAHVAGVDQIFVVTPPKPSPLILAAAHICGVTAVYQVGGAQAIAALAFGTESIPKVDKIVGAGNLFVTLAKQRLFGVVGIDGLAGPTETMVIADESANPEWLAADLLAQAEHDFEASAILLTPSEDLAKKVQLEVQMQLPKLSRKDIILASLSNSGGIVRTNSLDQAALLANDYGAEHLCLSVQDPEELMQKINNAGGFFLGDHSFEVLGDYIAGPSHIMPTGGTARFASPLNVLDFVKISSVIGLDNETAIELSSLAAEFAESETLTAHAAAARCRLELS